jgi:hypothetical protein
MDGMKCVETNPCNQSPYPCDANAMCVKTAPGSFVCLCNVGYQGDGKTCSLVPSSTGVNIYDPELLAKAKQAEKEKYLRLQEEVEQQSFEEREKERTQQIEEIKQKILDLEQLRRERKTAGTSLCLCLLSPSVCLFYRCWLLLFVSFLFIYGFVVLVVLFFLFSLCSLPLFLSQHDD